MKQQNVSVSMSPPEYLPSAELAQFMDLAHEAMILRDRGGGSLYWNRAAERLYGWSREDARAAPLDDLLRTRYQAEPPDLDRCASWEGAVTRTASDGADLPLLLRMTRRSAPDGGPDAILEAAVSN